MLLLLAASVAVSQPARKQANLSRVSEGGISNNASDTSMIGLYHLLNAIEQHPMLAEQRAAISAAGHRIADKSSLANPMLMLGVQGVPVTSFSFSQEMMTGRMIGISQMFPYPGKLGAERNIAAQDTVKSTFDLAEERNALRRDVKLAYFDLYHLDRAITTNHSHADAVDNLIASTEQRLTTATATQQDVLNLQLERSDIKKQIIEDQMMVAMKRSELERASGLPASEFNIVPHLGLPQLGFTLPELDSIAAIHRAKLAGIRSQVETYRRMSARNDLDKYPDFQVSLSYMQRDRLAPNTPLNPMPTAMAQNDLLSASVSFDLPFLHTNRREEATGEADAMRTMKLSQERAEKLDIHTMIETQLARLEGLRKEYELLKDEVLPAASTSLATTNANYTYNKASANDVLRNELAMLHREHDEFQIEAEYNKALAEIEYETGMDLVRYTEY